MPNGFRRRWSRPAVEAALVLVALLLMLAAGAGGFLVGRETADGDDGAAAAETTGETETEETTAETETGETETGEMETETETETTGTSGGDADGEAIFASAGCGSCHTFAPAGASGKVGPSLDSIDMSKDEIAQQIRRGGNGMPAYEGRLSDDEIDAVADYVENG
jgi:mono/diheme cytochrome c family protein